MPAQTRSQRGHEAPPKAVEPTGKRRLDGKQQPRDEQPGDDEATNSPSLKRLRFASFSSGNVKLVSPKTLGKSVPPRNFKAKKSREWKVKFDARTRSLQQNADWSQDFETDGGPKQHAHWIGSADVEEKSQKPRGGTEAPKTDYQGYQAADPATTNAAPVLSPWLMEQARSKNERIGKCGMLDLDTPLVDQQKVLAAQGKSEFEQHAAIFGLGKTFRGYMPGTQRLEEIERALDAVGRR